ncbi:hypothetical protein BKA70DRAFT_1107100 [Coprinopsis sp. MPI-PUGE-AT-0042]|nr:hypothetical protein BKA70DRAFT_1107100 [Coprinopsis sp. MPI-PUGE-AT-0042]
MPGPGFVLVDTPGFDDSNHTPDGKILEMIITWVNKSYPFGFESTRCGVIFLQDEDTSSGGNRTVGLLRKAFKIWNGGAVHLVNTPKNTTAISYIYNGTTFAGKGQDIGSVTSFCQGTVKTIIASNMPVRELLAELKKVHATISQREKKSQNKSWWERLKAKLRFH